jgi:RNA polymerase sigma factor (sigma-70 family)
LNFDALYSLYFRDVYLYIKSICDNDSIAEEITQLTFFQALKSIDQFDGSKDIRAWLFTIAKNSYFSYYKKSKRHTTLDELANDDGDTGVTISEQLANEEKAFIIHQFLHTMPEPYKEVFSLRVFGELPFDKIGKLFGKSSGWARVTFHRAKSKILTYMEEINYEQK